MDVRKATQTEVEIKIAAPARGTLVEHLKRVVWEVERGYDQGEATLTTYDANGQKGLTLTTMVEYNVTQTEV